MYYPYSIFGLIVLVLDIIAIIGVISGRSSVVRKLLWTLIVLILPLLGMALYFLIGRDGRDQIAA